MNVSHSEVENDNICDEDDDVFEDDDDARPSKNIESRKKNRL